jgi:PAS domain S-box-containing protein
MFITNARKEIIRVNKAFTSITGYLAAEAIGRTPAMLSSGRHDAAFYAAMHDCIERTGSWQGEIWNRRKSGETFPEWLTITAVRDSQQVLTHFVSTLTDITLCKAAEKEIRHLAFYDPLTQPPNRRLLMDRLQQAMAITSRRQAKCALLFLDLDHFKTLNDTLGHHKGDQLLQQVAARLSV